MRLGKSELWLLGLSLILRLVIVHHATWVPFSDTRDYHVLAKNLARGHGYFQVYEGEASEYQGLTLRAFRLPGYPAFLALIYSLLGWNPYWAYLANVASELATMLMILAIGQRLFDRRVALWAQGLFGLHVLWTPNLMTESLFTMMFVALVWQILGGRTVSLKSALSFGGLLAVAVFIRPIALVVLPLLLYEKLRLKHGTGRQWLTCSVIFLPLMVSLALWSARNHRTLGEPVLLSTNLGSHNTAAFGLDRQNLVLEARRRGLGEVEIDRLLREAIRDAILAAPLDTLGLYLRRAAELFSLEPAWEVDFLRQATFAGPEGAAWVEASYRILYLQYYAVYPLALVGGIWLLARRGGGSLAVLLVAFAAIHALVSDGNIRFAAPLYPFLCLLAGYGAARLLGLRPQADSANSRSITPSSSATSRS